MRLHIKIVQFLSMILLLSSCSYNNEKDEQIAQMQAEIVDLQSQLSELKISLEENNVILEQNKVRISDYLTELANLRKENKFLVASNETMTNEEIFNFKRGIGFVSNHFEPRVDLMRNLMNTKGLDKYYDPSFLKVGYDIGYLNVKSVEGLPWFVGIVSFEGEYIIYCTLAYHVIELDPRLTLTEKNNENVIENIDSYFYQRNSEYSISNREEFNEIVKTVDYTNKVLKLRVKNLVYIQDNTGTVEYIEVVELLDVIDN